MLGKIMLRTFNKVYSEGIKCKAVLMTEIKTANENVRQCLEYLCEKLNNV